MNGTRFKSAAGAALAFGIMASTAATAVAQTGSGLSFEGRARVGLQPGAPTNLLIDALQGFVTPGTPVGTVIALSTDGVFATPGGIVPGVQGTIQDLVVNMSGVVGRPITNFLTIGGFTFSLTSTPVGNTGSPVSLFEVAGSTTASLAVNGRVTGPGLGDDAFRYQGLFTAAFPGRTPAELAATVNSGQNLEVFFTSEFVVGTVPEPSTYALTAAGLVVLLGAARRRKRG